MKKSKRIATLAIMLALTLIFSFLPINFGGLSLALMILPLLVVAQIENFWTTLLAGIMLGVVNLIVWYTVGAANPLAFLFRNPLVSMLPRVLIGIVTFCVFRLCKKLFVKPKYQKSIGENGIEKSVFLNAKSVMFQQNLASFFATAFGVLTNTFFVGLMSVLLFAGKKYGDGVISAKFLLSLFSINFAIEIVVFSILCPPIVYAIRKQNRSI